MKKKIYHKKGNGLLHKIGAWLTLQKLLLYVVLLILEFGLLVLFFAYLSQFVNSWISLVVFEAVSFLFVVYIINTDTANEFKIAWIVLVLLFPIIGIVAYCLFGQKRMRKRKRNHYHRKLEWIRENCQQSHNLLKEAEHTDPMIPKVANLIYANCGMPLVPADECQYFSSGEEYFIALKAELSKATDFIFMEFFTIKQGEMWDRIFDILSEKAQKGVEIRITYDDMGSYLHLPRKFASKCASVGIQLHCFNKIRPLLDISQNNRSHRKIVIIDGKCAFTGGINIGDEYINKTHKLGHWKDTGIMIKGYAVDSLTMTFLLNWQDYFYQEELDKFLIHRQEEPKTHNSTFYIPFYDMPALMKTTCLDVYMTILYEAKKYAYINTPYLIIDDKMTAALIAATKRGVDVRITVPHIPDKAYVFALTRSFYRNLVLEGVKVYEYKPGFIHAKSIVSDGKYAVVGSSNLDFRSLYLHYENDVFIYDKQVVLALRQDYLSTCEESTLITKEIVLNYPLIKRIWRGFLRLFAPLM